MLTDDDIIEASEKKAALKAYHAKGGAPRGASDRLVIDIKSGCSRPVEWARDRDPERP